MVLAGQPARQLARLLVGHDPLAQLDGAVLELEQARRVGEVHGQLRVGGRATRRASSATHPSGRASSGLTSSSAISGWAAATADDRRDGARRPRRRRRAGGRARRAAAARPASASSSARHVVGAPPARARRRRRASASANTPPRPTMTTGPEARIAADAGDQLDAVARVRHALDAVAGRVQARGHGGVGGADVRLRGEPEGDAAGVGLVQQAERLQRDRAAELRGGGDRLVGAGDAAGRRERHAAPRAAARARSSSRRPPPARPGAGRAGTPRAGRSAPAASSASVRTASSTARKTGMPAARSTAAAALAGASVCSGDRLAVRAAPARHGLRGGELRARPSPGRTRRSRRTSR